MSFQYPQSLAASSPKPSNADCSADNEFDSFQPFRLNHKSAIHQTLQ